jgi:hypothetical protein
LRGDHRRIVAQRSQKNSPQWVWNADAGVLKVASGKFHSIRCIIKNASGCQPVREE